MIIGTEAAFSAGCLRIILTPETPFLASDTVAVDIGGKKFAGAQKQGEKIAAIDVPLEELLRLPVLDYSFHLVRSKRAKKVEPEFSPCLMLDAINIKSTEDYMERVQMLSRRIPDPLAIRFCAKHKLIHERAGFALRSVALCALGYRIVEGLDKNDPDLDFLWQEAEFTLQLPKDSATEFLYVRWTTSVTMMLVYAAMLQKDIARIEQYLTKTLSFRYYLPKASLLHTNFSRCDTLMGLLSLARRDGVAARAYFDDVDEVFRIGVMASDLSVKAGGYKFSEMSAVLKAGRVSARIRLAAAEAKGDDMVELARKQNLSDISGILGSLGRVGCWDAVIAKVSAP